MGLGLRKKYKLCSKLGWGTLRAVGKQKIFCVGCNKTGTTSLGRALCDLGYILGDQRTAEKIAIRDWARRDFRRMALYCRTAQVFQDAPFSFPYTYQAMDTIFPHSKFILTVRDSSEQWYESITRFHAKLWGSGEIPPSAEILKSATYIYKGFPWDLNRALFDSPEHAPYQKEVLTEYYIRHNSTVVEYFRHRPDDLLVLNVAEEGAYPRLCRFLGVDSDSSTFPWENKT